MVFSDTSGLGGIVEDIDFLCDTNATSYPLKDKARNVNRWLYRCVAWIMEASPMWEFDDTNQTTLPVARTNLVVGQQDYSLPSELLRVNKVCILDENGNEAELFPLTFDQFKARTLTTPTNARPSHYCIRGGSILIDPPAASAQVTTTNGLRLYLSRDIDLFASTDTTQEPGIPEVYHRILSLGASSDYWVKYDATKSNSMLAQIEAIRREAQKFSASRQEDVKPAVRPVVRTRQYM